LWTVHLMPFYALFVYSGPPRSHDDLAPTARWFVVVLPMLLDYLAASFARYLQCTSTSPVALKSSVRLPILKVRPHP
jgi:hypothetical protein